MPSGASTGSREAVELRDGDKTRYRGKGVKNAVANVNGEIAQALQGLRCGGPKGPRRQADRARRHAEQGQARRERAARRIAGRRACRCASKKLPLWKYLRAASRAVSLPVPMMNIINGGAHADNNVDMQEFMVLPVGVPNFAEALRAGVGDFPRAESGAEGQGLNTAVGDEGGFAPDLKSNERGGRNDPRSDRQDGLQGRQGRLARPRRGQLASSTKTASTTWPARARSSTSEQLVDFYADWCAKYPIVTIEDGMAEGDRDGWKPLTAATRQEDPAGRRRQLRHQSGDLPRGIDDGIANAILIKVNQIGTLTRNARGDRDGRRSELRRGRLASFRRNRGHDDRRHRRRDHGDPDQDRSLCRRTAWRSTTSCCASRKRWAAAAKHGGRAAFPNVSGLVGLITVDPGAALRCFDSAGLADRAGSETLGRRRRYACRVAIGKESRRIKRRENQKLRVAQRGAVPRKFRT